MLLLLPLLSEASVPEVQAILGSKVVIGYMDKRLTLAPGESKQGVELIEIRGDSAILRVNGRERAYRLGERTRMMTNYAEPDAATLRLEAGRDGMYRADGRINGRSIQFMVDTGASAIALNARHARSMGLDYRNQGVKTVVQTASATEVGYRIRLNKVHVGQIVLYDVMAVVIDSHSHPPMALLGNSFLNRIDMSRAGRSLILKQR